MSELKNLIEDVNKSVNTIREKAENGASKEELAAVEAHFEKKFEALQDAFASANTVSSHVDVEAEEAMKEKADVAKFFTKADSDVAAMTVAPQGGYLLPTTFNDMVDGLNRKFSPLRQLAKVVPGEMNFVTNIKITQGDAGLRGEFDALHYSAAPKYDRLNHTFQEINSTEAVSLWASQNTNSQIDYTNSVIEDVLKAMAEQEGAFFMNGTVQQAKASGGTIKNGLLQQTKLVAGVDEYTNVIGSLAGIETAGEGVVNIDDIINLLFSLHDRYEASTSILTSRELVKAILTQKDENGRYILDIAGVPGSAQAASVLGKGIVVSNYFPTFASAGDTPVAIAGDFKAGVTIVDAGKTRWLVDPYTDKRQLQYTGQRLVSSAPVNYNALRALYVKSAS